MPWHLSQQPCRYCGRRSAPPWWEQAVLVLPHSSGRKAACGSTERACGPSALPQHQQPAWRTRHMQWQGTANTSGKRCERWGYSGQNVGPPFCFPINKASVYMTTASEVCFSCCCSCLVKLFTAIHFSQPITVQKHLTVKSVTNILFFGYTVPSSPWLNKLERDFQSSWNAVHFTGEAARTASVQTNIQALLHFSPVLKPSISHHLQPWLLLLAGGNLQKA